MTKEIRRGEIVTYWLIAERCLCENNGHPPAPTLPPEPEPEIVTHARAMLAGAGEFDDDEMLQQIHPMAFAELEAHRARHAAASERHTREWVAARHPMHDHLEIKGQALRERARIEAMSGPEIAALYEPSAAELAELAAMSDDQVAEKFGTREKRAAAIAEHARATLLEKIPTDGVHAAACGHLRTLTGYPATVVGRVVDVDPETGKRSVYYQLEVDFPKTLTDASPTRNLGYIRRQGHCELAEGRRPESGEFTRRATS